MISYRQFKKLYETDAVTPPEAATPQAPNIEDLEKQIDAIFDDLKSRIRQMYTPRSDWTSRARAFAAQLAAQRNKTESVSLVEYHEINRFFSDFQEALDVADIEFIDRTVDEYKAKFKQIMGTYKQQVAAATPARTRRPRRRPEPVPAAGSTVTTTQPEPAATVTQPEPAATVTQPATVTKPEPEPEPEPAPAPATTTVTRPPATTVADPVSEPAAAGGLSPEEKELIKLGAMVMYWHDDLGQLNAIPQNEMEGLEKAFADFKPEDHIDDKDYLIRLAKDYKAKIAGGADPEAGPIKGDIEAKPEEQPVPTSTAPVKAEEAKPLTKRQLMQMSEAEFKQYMLDSANPFADPQLDEMYFGEEWWKRSMRSDVVENYLLALQDRLKKKESLQHYVNKYKKLLREEKRPQFLLREAVRLPLSKRAGFYRKQLSCRGT